MKTEKKPSISYEEGLLNRLKDTEYAAEYVNAHLEDNDFDPKSFLLALRDVATAFGFADIASETGLGRESLYKTLSNLGNPKLTTLSSVLSVMGLKIQVICDESKRKKKKSSKSGQKSRSVA